jgi:uncharacterized protein (UPF0332 family)
LDPLDFYELSKEIRSSSSRFSEALERTIVGRIYYAIFLMVREELRTALKGSRYESLFDSLSQKGVIHSLVVQALSKIEVNRHLSNLLYSMRRRREAADYRMRGTKNWQREIDDTILEAEEILQDRSRLQPSFSQEIAEIETLVLTWHSKIAAGS